MTSAGTYELQDPRALRALAHPLRGKLLASLRMDGPATASMLGRRYGESSGAASYHLRVLERWGFVEDDPAHHGEGGRERWWRAAHETTTWSPSAFRDGDPASTEAMRAFLERVGMDYFRYYRQWIAEQDGWSEDWQDAALITDRFMRLTASQLAALGRELDSLIARYAALGPEDESAERIAVIAHAFPQRGPMP